MLLKTEDDLKVLHRKIAPLKPVLWTVNIAVISILII